MGGVLQVKSPQIQQLASLLSFTGMVIWSMALPFAEVQDTRFTSIGILTLLGSFLISFASRKTLVTISKSDIYFFAPLTLLFFLPLLDLWRCQSFARSWHLVMIRIPFLIVPFLIHQHQKKWPPHWTRIAFGLFAISLLINILLSISVGIEQIQAQLLSDQSNRLKLWLSRPYYGLLIGCSMLVLPSFWYRNRVSKLLSLISVGFGVWFLWLVLAKMALLAFGVSAGLVGGIFLYNSLKNRLLRLIFLLSIAGAPVLLSLFFFQSGIWSDLHTLGNIEYSTVPKVYSNSLNTRLVIWKASFQVLSSEMNWLTGVGTENAQPLLDSVYKQLNPFVYAEHLNPHNVPLSLWLSHGLVGLAVWFIIFFRLIKASIKPFRAKWLLVAIFFFISGLSEVYIDRDLGVQFFVWMLVLLYFHDNQRLNKEVGQNDLDHGLASPI